MHLEFIFVYDEREKFCFILLHMSSQVSQHHLLSRKSGSLFLLLIFVDVLEDRVTGIRATLFLVEPQRLSEDRPQNQLWPQRQKVAH